MKSKMNKRKSRIPYYVLFLAIVIIASVVVYIAYISDSQIKQCIENLRGLEYPGSFAEGSISLIFSSNITDSDIISLIKSYGLTSSVYASMPQHKFVIVYVPNGKEFEWICRFKQNEIVFGTDVNRIFHAN